MLCRVRQVVRERNVHGLAGSAKRGLEMARQRWMFFLASATFLWKQRFAVGEQLWSGVKSSRRGEALERPCRHGCRQQASDHGRNWAGQVVGA